MSNQDDFYVGYMPKAPTSVARLLKPAIAITILVCLLLAAILVSGQKKAAPSVFEFGKTREFQGVIIEKPYPMLAVARPGIDAGHSLYYLVQQGKFGAHEPVKGMDGQEVNLEGTLIYRDGQTMVELTPRAIKVLGDKPTPAISQDAIDITLTGEIVDSKCFLGVMNPGDLTTHRECAILCIQGGIPPVLLVRDPQGKAFYFLLAFPNNQLPDDWRRHIAIPVEVKGNLSSQADTWILNAKSLKKI